MLRAAVGRLIPTRFRASLLRSAARLLVPAARPGWSQSDHGKVTIAGLLTSPSGMGEGARLAAARLAELGYEVGGIDLTPGLGLPREGQCESLAITGRDIGGPLIVHLNPPSFQVALLRLLRRHRADRKLIAYWAWETSEAPPDWREAFRLVAIGIAVGIALSAISGKLLQTILLGVVNTADFATWSIVLLTLVAVAIVAALVPARRAARIDPIQALRAE